MLCDKAIHVLELSALRQNELRPMLDGISELDLSQFHYIAVHAPSQIEAKDEPEVVEMILEFAERGWPVVLHPDAIHDFSLWQKLGELLCILAFREISPLIPEQVPIILETPVSENEIDSEIKKALEALPVFQHQAVLG